MEKMIEGDEENGEGEEEITEQAAVAVRAMEQVRDRLPPALIARIESDEFMAECMNRCVCECSIRSESNRLAVTLSNPRPPIFQRLYPPFELTTLF